MGLGTTQWEDHWDRYWLPCRPNAAVLWWDQELEAAWDEMWPPKMKRAPSGFRLRIGAPNESTPMSTGTLRELCE